MQPVDSRTAFCPECGKDVGRYRVDLPNEHKVGLYCTRCHTQLMVVHGRGQLRVIKQGK